MDAVGAAAVGPQLLSDVGGEGGQHKEQGLGGLVPGGALHGAPAPSLHEAVGHLHEGGDKGVEAEALDVLRGFVDGAVGKAAQTSGEIWVGGAEVGFAGGQV